MRNLGTKPVEQIVEKLHVKTADIRHYAELINLWVSHVIRSEQGWDTQVLLSNLVRAGSSLKIRVREK